MKIKKKDKAVIFILEFEITENEINLLCIGINDLISNCYSDEIISTKERLVIEQFIKELEK
jgi:hypothetical protein